ncbi:HAD family hydrolase [Sphingomonas sp. ID0503]|uniref:HAD family hydrolase n=1 Tax=Sphingomonas sp. ID0503 TaxID=3399691 RepID=UPI003AFA7FE4
MSRPLLITDCDEVLLHMISHFSSWLNDEHEIALEITRPDFVDAFKRADGSVLAHGEIWPLFDSFFGTEMHRQTMIPHAGDALAAIGEVADIVVLTNLTEDCRFRRIDQLATLGVHHRVICNQGGKGPPVKRLLAEYQPSVAVFVDDLAGHHRSVAEDAPEVWRVHMIGEPDVAAVVPAAPAAHVRIDDWREAEGWILNRFADGKHAA